MEYNYLLIALTFLLLPFLHGAMGWSVVVPFPGYAHLFFDVMICV